MCVHVYVLCMCEYVFDRFLMNCYVFFFLSCCHIHEKTYIGEIEISIFAQIFDKVIVVFNIQTSTFLQYGDFSSHKEMIFLMYVFFL